MSTSPPIMIRRETDPELANRLSNEPGVVGNISYDGRVIDWGPAVETCIILSNGEDAVQVYEPKAPRVFEVMTIFAETCRGKRALETAYAMRDYMLPHLDTCFGSIPDRLPAAKWFYRKIGGKPVEAVETDDAIYTANPNETLFLFEAEPFRPVFQTRDADLVSSFANDPDILPGCGYPEGTTHVDVSAQVANPNLVFVTDGIGAMICFEWNGDEWQFHSLFRKNARGRRAITLANAMFRWLRDNQGAHRLFGVCPVENKGVIWFCRQLGMSLVGSAQSPIVGDVEIYEKDLSCL